MGNGKIELTYHGYSAVTIKTLNHTLIIDPSNLIGKETIEKIKSWNVKTIILYTHDHYDHYHEETLKTLYSQLQCPIIVDPSMTMKTSRIIPREKIHPATHETKMKIFEAWITGIKGKHVGPITLYQIQVDGIGIFHGGDSAHVNLTKHRADIAITPTGEPSPTANPIDAYKMVIDLKPKIAIAIHGSKTQHQQFKNLVEKDMPTTKIIIPTPGETITLTI